MSFDLPPAGIWVIEPSHSTIEAVARHLRITKVRGRFASFEGKVEIGEDPLESRLEVTIDAKSIDTNSEDRDAHLRSPDFLDAENHPTLSFTSTDIAEKGDGYVLTGDLTMAGQTNAVAFDVEYGGLTEDPWGNTRALFAAETTINREDWGLTWNQALEAGGVLVSKKIDIEIQVQLLQG
jgi:polyisoprenoid-binding protein YceI